MHGTWKEYENNSMSLLMAKQTDVWDSTTRPHLCVIVILRFHIVKKQRIYFSLCSLFPVFHIVL